MKTYARVDNGVVVEIIPPSSNNEGGGADIPIEDRFTPEFVESLVDITTIVPPPGEHWTYDGEVFAAPVPYQPTAEEIERVNTSSRNYLLGLAALAIAPLQDAVDLDEATTEESAALKKWKLCRIAINRVDLTMANPVWPTLPA